MSGRSAPDEPQPVPSNRKRWLVFGGIGCAAILGVCVVISVLAALLGGSDDTDDMDDTESTPTVEIAAEPTHEPTETPPATPTPEPTPTAAPTETPEPTATPEPTPTPEPTSTPEPTPTPEPTATPEPPPEPVFYSGNGDDVINIEKPGGPGTAALVYVRGNDQAGHFAVTTYNEVGDYLDLLVNTTDPYAGLVPLDFRDGQETTQMEISATGGWEIEIRPLEAIDVYGAPGEVSGSGDYVFAFDGDTTTAFVEGNAGEQHFAVLGYGSRPDLMINTTDRYEGRVRVDPGTFIIEVSAVGDWRIVFE